jgi:hypothetical protein
MQKVLSRLVAIKVNRVYRAGKSCTIGIEQGCE